jgi:putative addiction module CopG family antidote
VATIALELPAELQHFVEARAQAGHFVSSSEYIVALVDAARRSRSSLEAALLEGLESGPAEEWTRQEWLEIQQRVIARQQKG